MVGVWFTLAPSDGVATLLTFEGLNWAGIRTILSSSLVIVNYIIFLFLFSGKCLETHCSFPVVHRYKHRYFELDLIFFK